MLLNNVRYAQIFDVMMSFEVRWCVRQFLLKDRKSFGLGKMELTCEAILSELKWEKVG